jgi:hypothetical protein
MTKDEALIQRLREEAAHDLHYETVTLLLEAAEALAQPAPVQTRAVHITWNSDGIRTVNGVPDYTPPAASDLLNALKRIVDEPNNTMSDGKALKEIIRIARLAIAKATGEQP